MLYMLDTNICGYIIRNKPQAIKEKLQEIEKRMQSVYNIHDCVVVKKVVKEKDALCAYPLA